MNLFQKFLLLFSDYRSLRDENIRLGDEVTTLRAKIEDERTRYDSLMDRFVSRETTLTDRFLEQSKPRVVINPERKTQDPAEFANAQAWVAKKKADFAQQLQQRARALNGPEQSSVNPN